MLTRPDAPAGRGRRVRSSPVAEAAREAGVPVLQPRRLRDEGALDELRALEPDCCPVVAYGQLVPRDALDVPPHGWVNLHFSLLPAWRGAAPVQHAVLAGDDVTGATTFLLEEGLDTGPVLGTLTEAVRPRDTSGDLLGRLAVSGAELLEATLDGLADGRLEARPQPDDGVSLAPKVEPEDARLDWTHPAVAVDRRARACTPAPGPWTTWRGRRLKLTVPPEPAAGPALEPGELRRDDGRLLVGTATTPLRLVEVQPEGRARTDASAWANGAQPGPDERLGG